MTFFHGACVFLLLTFVPAGCQKKGTGGGTTPPLPPPASSEVAAWVTKGDGSALLTPSSAPLNFSNESNSFPYIDIDTAQTFQSVQGFGYTLTGGSVDLLQGMDAGARQSLLRELFSRDSTAIGVSYLRISMGASDLSAQVFSYNDLPPGQTDADLQQFSLRTDTVNLIPVLKQILAIQPSITILASPWSAPPWMKTNGSTIGGSLLPQYYGTYARYFVKYLQAMQAKGIPVAAVTIQNEPMHGGNNPSMLMTAAEQALFIKQHLGPALAAAGLNTRIIVWDHNCDNPGYPIEVLNDPAAKAFVDGSAFHLYNGDISALSTVHGAHPDRHVYFTEQYTASTGSFAGDLRWHIRNVIIGSMRNWSRNALEWNLANDAQYGPHTPGGCTTCKGALTISGNTVLRNVAYYIIGHASKAVLPGSLRVASTETPELRSAAFLRPDGRKVLIVLNDGNSSRPFNIRFKGKWITSALDAGAVASFLW